MLNQFNQPFIINNSTLFLDEVNAYFNDYKIFSSNLIKSYVKSSEDIEHYEKEIKKNVDSISKCLVNYRNGHRIECADNFQLLMLKNIDRLIMILKKPESEKKSNHTFFRIRKGEIGLKERKETPNHTLFHLPFNLRHLVGTGRFNSAGIPILYLSDCLRIPYHECDEPKTSFCNDVNGDNNMNVGFFRNAKSFRYLDFSIQPWQSLIQNHNQRPTESPLLNYLVLYPIIAAIHVKINFTYAVNFRFDYVFSSLIMDFVKNLEIDNIFKDTGMLLPIYSVKYSSVKLFSKQSVLYENSDCYLFHNYAFLTKYYQNTSHCLNLESIFLNNGINKTLYSNDAFLDRYKNKDLTKNDILEIEEHLKK